MKAASAAKPGAPAVLEELKRMSSAKVRAGMIRYGLPSDKALGVGVGEIQKYGKRLGRSQALAEALWKTDVYEARLLASFVGEAEKLTPATMNRWCRGFDNWGVVDTVCFKLFDQSPHAWKLIEPWAKMKGEFQCRAGFVLLACVAAHSEDIPDERFVHYLPLIEQGSTDERNFVKKGVSWALRMIGRQGPAIHAASVELSRRLAESDSPSARWIGRGALKELTSPAVRKKAAGRARPLGAP